MQERATVRALAVKTTILFVAREPEVLQEGAHRREVQRGKANVGNVFDANHRRRGGALLDSYLTA